MRQILIREYTYVQRLCEWVLDKERYYRINLKQFTDINKETLRFAQPENIYPETATGDVISNSLSNWCQSEEKDWTYEKYRITINKFKNSNTNTKIVIYDTEYDSNNPYWKLEKTIRQQHKS